MFDYSQYAKRLQLTIEAPSLLLLGPQALTASTPPPEAGGDVRGGDIQSQFSSVAQSRPTLCEPMDCSMPGLPVHHQLPELTQTHVHRIGDAIQPSHPVLPFSSCLQSFPASGSFPVSQFFSSGGQSIGVSASSVLPMNIQDDFQLTVLDIYRPLPVLEWTGWISLQSKGLSGVFSNTTVQKHQFLGTQLSL